MMELIDSKYTREKYKELGIEFTDWQKAAILSQKPLPHHERINALLDFSKEIEDTILMKQIEERVSYEKKMLEYFVRNIDDKYVYVVKDIIDECEYGYFSIFETALVQARKIVKRDKIKMKIEKHLIIKDTVIPKGVLKIGWNRYLFPDKPETEEMETDFLGLLRGDIILNLDGEIESICSSEISDEEERMVDGFDNERFEGQFIKVPYVHKAGMLVRYANTDKYAVLATSEKEWNDFLEKVESGIYVSYFDNALIVYELREEGYWSHQHWSPFFIEELKLTENVVNTKNFTYWQAMDALSDYLAGDDSFRQEELVIRTAKEYANSSRKLSEIGQKASQAVKIEDIMW